MKGDAGLPGDRGDDVSLLLSINLFFFFLNYYFIKLLLKECCSVVHWMKKSVVKPKPEVHKENTQERIHTHEQVKYAVDICPSCA